MELELGKMANKVVGLESMVLELAGVVGKVRMQVHMVGWLGGMELELAVVADMLESQVLPVGS